MERAKRGGKKREAKRGKQKELKKRRTQGGETQRGGEKHKERKWDTKSEKA